MARRVIIAALTAGIFAGLAVPAAAQFGGLFGNSNPPRPPGSIPTGPIDRDTQFRTSNYPPATPLPPGPPPGSGPPPSPPPDAIQSQPLPPPPGAASPTPDAAVPGAAPGTAPDGTPATAAPATSPAAGAPPGAAPPGAAAPGAPEQTPPAGGTQNATATPPSDEVVIQPPATKIVNPVAIFAGLDKITGRIISFEVKMGETVQFGALQVTPHACYTRPPTETGNTDGFVDVDEVTLEGKVKRIFTGWMFTASPGLHAVEHPIYDVWLTDCKGGAPTVTAEVPSEPAAAAPPAGAAPPRAQRPARRAPPPPGAVPPPRQ